MLGKHNYLVRFKAGEIARQLGNALVAPVVAYVPEGDINPPTGHMRFAGTITTPQDVFATVLEYAARSFRQHGFLDIALVGEDSGRSTIDALPEIVEAVRSRMPILIDSGFRRGTDIAKALCMGATGVCSGRPYIWGLGAFGQPGVERVLELLRIELSAIMQQVGAPSVKHFVPGMVRRTNRES